MKQHLKATIVGALAFAPALAFAETLGGILDTIGQLIGAATPIVVALALVYFFWGLGQFILGSADEGKRKEAISIMIYGIIALFVMVSIWGIINVLQTTFSISGSGTVTPPTVDRSAR
ncbi:MAG: pilin [Candidatus Pacebacteria bacterium]|nr:pilin [Candidatus Paceibacterota bacterium]